MMNDDMNEYQPTNHQAIVTLLVPTLIFLNLATNQTFFYLLNTIAATTAS